MERAVAIKKLTKILGKSLYWRIDLKAPYQEGRDEARVKLCEASPKCDALNKQVQARMAAILQADTEYQQLKAAYAEAKKYRDELWALSNHYRFTVGTKDRLFFSIKAQGDSWEEVIAKLSRQSTASTD